MSGTGVTVGGVVLGLVIVNDNVIGAGTGVKTGLDRG